MLGHRRVACQLFQRVRPRRGPVPPQTTSRPRGVEACARSDGTLVPLGAYRHKRDLTRWSGLHVAGDRLVLFGPDANEVLAQNGGRIAPQLALDPGKVGSIIDLEILSRDPAHPVALATLGSLRESQGRREEAASLYERFLASAPADTPVRQDVQQRLLRLRGAM